VVVGDFHNPVEHIPGVGGGVAVAVSGLYRPAELIVGVGGLPHRIGRADRCQIPIAVVGVAGGAAIGISLGRDGPVSVVGVGVLAAVVGFDGGKVARLVVTVGGHRALGAGVFRRCVGIVVLIVGNLRYAAGG